MIAGQHVLCDVFKCECSAALRRPRASAPDYRSLVCQPLIQQPAQQQFLLVLWLRHDFFGGILCAFSYILSFTRVPLNSNLIKWVLHIEEMTKPGDRPFGCLHAKSDGNTVRLHRGTAATVVDTSSEGSSSTFWLPQVTRHRFVSQ